MATARRVTAEPPSGVPGGEPSPHPSGRRPFRDNPRLILLGIAILLAALAAMIALADRSTELAPDFLSEVVLYALSLGDLTMLVGLGFLLARNIIKLVIEQRRALPFARFRARLVAVLLGMTLIPALLVLMVGSELIRNSTERWFSAPIDEVLSSANEIASDYYRERELAVSENASRIARALVRVDLAVTPPETVRRIIGPEVDQARVGVVEIYRIERLGAEARAVPVVDFVGPVLPPGYSRVSADRLATRVATGRGESRTLESLQGGGELMRAATLVRANGGRAAGVVVATDYLAGELATHSRRIVDAYEGYTQLRVLKRPLAGVYLSFFLLVTLMILVSATWVGLYLTKQITRPIQRLSVGAKAIGAGHLDHRIERDAADEFGSLIDAFNAMASEVAAGQHKLERSRLDLERKNQDVEARRRYIETILERIATGVVSIDAAGRVSTINSAATKLLGLDASSLGRPAASVFSRADLSPLNRLLRGVTEKPGQPAAQEIALARDGRELHLAAAVTTLQGEGGSEGTVLVLDDVTPLIRAQRVSAWRDVARRLAHEIKNPLTPIQLCAERIGRHLGGAPPAARTVINECTETIVGEVESLKALVDEFAQFARMPAPRTVPTDLHALLQETLALYNGLFQEVTIEQRAAPELPPVRVDPEQIRRVIINLVDNAVEALAPQPGASINGHKGLITIETQYDSTNAVARIIVADNGPGIPLQDQEKLFMPYYSTKRRGSGLGLAIVRRIVAEHGGSIVAGDNVPKGTRFTIELPC